MEPGATRFRRSMTATRMATGVPSNASSIHLPLLLREHQVQVLNGSAGCTFAEIIENRR